MADSLGVWLRQSREARKLDLEDVVRTLRIRRRYLQALELGDYEALPGPIQARGFLRNYARYLGLPTEDALARYDAEVRGVPLPPRMPEVAMPAAKGSRTWAPPPPSVEEERAAVRASSSDSLLRIFIAIFAFFALFTLIVFIWLQFGQGLALGGVTSTPVATRQGAAQTAAAPTMSATPIFPVSDDGIVQVRLVPTSHTWVSMSVDERIIFQGVADPEQPLEGSASEILIVTTGDGAAFHLYVNGVDWGALGGPGEVVRRAWTPNGETPIGDS